MFLSKVHDLDPDDEEEWEIHDNVVIVSPGGGPCYEPVVVGLAVVVEAHDQVELFVLNSKWVCFGNCLKLSLLWKDGTGAH